MSDDIVARLRRSTWRDCIEAADEIERIRAERDVARREVCARFALIYSMTVQEVEKLRGWDCFPKPKPHTCGLCGCECEPVNDKGDCRMCERAQYGS